MVIIITLVLYKFNDSELIIITLMLHASSAVDGQFTVIIVST